MARNRFSLATFNVKNLVNAETNYYQRPDGSWNRYSATAFARKIDWLAEQLVRMSADHVFVQEVFHAEALQRLADRHAEIVAARNLPQAPYGEVLFFPNDRSAPDDPGPGLGYLGRKPVLSHRKVQDLSADPIRFGAELGFEYTLQSTSRPIAIVEIDLGAGRSGVVLNAHLKSKRQLLAEGSLAGEAENLLFLERAKGSIASLVLRAGEALALRREVLTLTRGSSQPVFVVGDLNDEGGAVTTEVILGEAPWRHEAIEVKRAFWDVELYSAARAHLRRSETSDFTTHIFNGHHGTIDHILLSQEFYYRNTGPSRVGDLDYVRVYNDHLVDQDMPGAPREGDASDHGQIVAFFSFEVQDGPQP